MADTRLEPVVLSQDERRTLERHRRALQMDQDPRPDHQRDLPLLRPNLKTSSLADLGQRLLDANKTRIDRVTTGDSRPGRQLWVYGRAGRPCRRCGTPIRRGEQGPPGQERLRFWCPNCQR